MKQAKPKKNRSQDFETYLDSKQHLSSWFYKQLVIYFKQALISFPRTSFKRTCSEVTSFPGPFLEFAAEGLSDGAAQSIRFLAAAAYLGALEELDKLKSLWAFQTVCPRKDWSWHGFCYWQKVRIEVGFCTICWWWILLSNCSFEDFALEATLLDCYVSIQRIQQLLTCQEHGLSWGFFGCGGNRSR